MDVGGRAAGHAVDQNLIADRKPAPVRRRIRKRHRDEVAVRIDAEIHRGVDRRRRIDGDRDRLAGRGGERRRAGEDVRIPPLVAVAAVMAVMVRYWPVTFVAEPPGTLLMRIRSPTWSVLLQLAPAAAQRHVVALPLPSAARNSPPH